MAVEFSAFTGLVAVDRSTIAYFSDRPHSPRGEFWQQAVDYWRGLVSDPAAHFDRQLDINASEIEPTVTWGTSPQHSIAISGLIPDPDTESNATLRTGMQRALEYQGLRPAMRATDIPIDAAFIGSCTNSRLSDLRIAAAIVDGCQVADGVAAVVVPGSGQVKRAAEAEGLDQIFKRAGFEWREPGCSMCFYAGGETFGSGKRVLSTTNRNFEGRQGPQTRTHLASPATVAASAIRGKISDPRALLPLQ